MKRKCFHWGVGRMGALRLSAALIVLTLGSLLAVASASADPGDPTFGNTTPGSASGAPGSNINFGSVYPLAEQGVTVTFNFYASGNASDQSYVPVVYNVDGTGNPTTLALQGDPNNPVIVPAGAEPGWFSTPLPATTLPPGDYLVGLLSGPTGGGANIFFDPVTDAAIFNRDSTYPNPSATWETTPGSSGNANQQLSFYVEYQRVAAASSGGQSPQLPPPPPRSGYCLNGTFVNLIVGQPDRDPAYAGAVPAPYYEGLGLTCDPVPGYGAVRFARSADGSGTDGPKLVNSMGTDLGPGDADRLHPYYAKQSS